MVTKIDTFVRAADVDEVRDKACLAAQVEGHTLVLFAYGDRVYAVDNRCPHMGFPLDRGTVRDGILTCHWHHARFDLASGGTFDQFADDVRAFPVEIRDGEVWAMAGASPRHNRISARCIAELDAALRGRPCVPLGSDQRVHVPATHSYCYPDVTVVCGVKFEP